MEKCVLPHVPEKTLWSRRFSPIYILVMFEFILKVLCTLQNHLELQILIDSYLLQICINAYRRGFLREETLEEATV